MRKTIIAFLICLAGCFLISGAVAFYRGAGSRSEFGEIHLIVSICVAVLGAIIMGGAGTGGVPYTEYAAESVSFDADEYRRVQDDDTDRGIGYGLIVFLTAIVSGAIAYFIII